MANTSRTGIAKRAPMTAAQREVILSASKPLVQRFFRNVDYLLELKGISKRQFEKDMNTQYNFGISREAIHHFVSGFYEKVNTFYLGAYCAALGEPIERMVSIDYAAEALLSRSDVA